MCLHCVYKVSDANSKSSVLDKLLVTLNHYGKIKGKVYTMDYPKFAYHPEEKSIIVLGGIYLLS